MASFTPQPRAPSQPRFFARGCERRINDGSVSGFLRAKADLPGLTGLNDLEAPDANDEYLLYQTLVGTWPMQGVVAPSPMLSGCCDDGVAATIGEVRNVARRRRVLRETLKLSIGIHLLGQESQVKRHAFDTLIAEVCKLTDVFAGPLPNASPSRDRSPSAS